MITIAEVDLSYPIIQSCGPRYAKEIKNIFETLDCVNSFNFGFGRHKYTGTVYFIKKGSNIINVITDTRMDPELRKHIILIKNFWKE